MGDSDIPIKRSAVSGKRFSVSIPAFCILTSALFKVMEKRVELLVKFIKIGDKETSFIEDTEGEG